VKSQPPPQRGRRCNETAVARAVNFEEEENEEEDRYIASCESSGVSVSKARHNLGKRIHKPHLLLEPPVRKQQYRASARLVKRRGLPSSVQGTSTGVGSSAVATEGGGQGT
jgi:hypothetical protein